MELESVVGFLENKTILITGATGFLAKIFLEKVLRVQPNVKRIYLLLRAAEAESAYQRWQHEVIEKDLFSVLKEKWGANWRWFISEKTSLVPGDISLDDELGVKDHILVEEMFAELDVVINLAATTNFDERYDVALGVNTMGAKHVLCFAKKCIKLPVLIHVSTAFVSGETSGLILETAYEMGEALNGTSGLNIDDEIKLARERLNQLQADGATTEQIRDSMKDLGIERAKVYGWPNTYVFTKAIGEMVVRQLKGNMSVAIVRPTIISSTYKEPFPGWIEGLRTIDSLAFFYGTGRLTFLPGDVESIVDVIPADMVVNAMLVAMVAHAIQPLDRIYHVSSSQRNPNPLRYNNVQDCCYRYFSKNPWIGKNGKPVAVSKGKVLGNMASFRRYVTIRYLLPLKGLQLANVAFCCYFNGMINHTNRKITLVMRLVELYRPFLFFSGVFDDTNTENLRMASRERGTETDIFYFDPGSIDLREYLMNIHLPGLVKYAFK